MFLSIFENRLDKKGRVSVPASYRAHLSSLGYNGIICFPSFNNQSIEAWSQDRIEKISNSIDTLNPFDEKKDYFATSILSESIDVAKKSFFSSKGLSASILFEIFSILSWDQASIDWLLNDGKHITPLKPKFDR